MAQSLATYIALPGNTAEVLEHWHQVFGGELFIMRYAHTPLEDMPFEPDPNAVAHAVLTLPTGVIAASDVMDHEHDYPLRDTAYSLLYTTDSPDEARQFIAGLLAGGGQVGMPFEQAP